jgi:hypothetical protein
MPRRCAGACAIELALRNLDQLGSGENVGDGGWEATVRVRPSQKTIRESRDLLVTGQVFKHLRSGRLVAG